MDEGNDEDDEDDEGVTGAVIEAEERVGEDVRDGKTGVERPAVWSLVILGR